MKLASLKGGRDGRLIVVSRDLARAADASAVAPTLREALDDWAAAEPRLQEIANSLEAGRIAHGPFDPKKCAAPLPRSFGWADGSAYVNHVALVRKSRGAEVPPTFWTDPLMYRGASDEFIGPCDPIRAADTAWGIDLEAEVAVVVTDVPQGATPAQTAPLIRLFMLVNDVSLRNLIPASSPRALASCRVRDRPHSRRSRSPRTNWARPSTARRCICRCSARSTVSRSAGRTPAST